MSPKLEIFIRNHLDLYGSSFQDVRKKYTSNISPDAPTDVPVYICPLCVNQLLFIRDNLLHITTNFSADHFPPETVGGKRKALVCTDCNSQYGKSIDFALPAGLKVNSSLMGTAESPCTLQLHGSKSVYNVSASWKTDLISLKDNQQKSHLLQEFKDAAKNMEETGQPITFNMKIKLPPAELVMRSLLKAAYLYFFSWAGYEFIYSATASKIRQVLLGQLDHPLENLGVFYDQQLGQVEEGIYALTEPEPCKAFFVSLHMADPATNRKIQNIIVIPSMNEKAWDAQTAFAAWKNKQPVEVEFLRFSPDRMESGKHFSYSRITKKILS
jgi:hypothetical protein